MLKLKDLVRLLNPSSFKRFFIFGMAAPGERQAGVVSAVSSDGEDERATDAVQGSSSRNS
jgi:hypothetical protein